MKWIQITTAMAISLASSGSWADAASQAQAAELLQSMGMEKAMNASVEQMLEVQMKQNPSLQPLRHVMADFFRQYMSYEALKEELVVVYGNAFTVEELQDITRFYQTPTGQKSIKIMPELMTKGAEIGLAQVRRHMPELQQMIKKEAARLQKK